MNIPESLADSCETSNAAVYLDIFSRVIGATQQPMRDSSRGDELNRSVKFSRAIVLTGRVILDSL